VVTRRAREEQKLSALNLVSFYASLSNANVKDPTPPEGPPVPKDAGASDLEKPDQPEQADQEDA
jgi:hypothetical protein